MNIPGGDVSKGEEISGYIGSGPPKDTGEFLESGQTVFLHFDLSGMFCNLGKGA